MPTCSWILERDSDAFYAAIDNVPGPINEVERSWKCPFCVAWFQEAEAWRQHLSNTHSGQRPFLTIGGSEPSSSDTIRRRVDPKRVAILNATSVKISHDNLDFVSVTESELSRQLAESCQCRLWIRLGNRFDNNADPINTTYDLSFRVYDDGALLEGVDRVFVRLLGKDSATMDDVYRFLRETESFSVPDYSSAMADYVIGVLIKDGDDRTGVRAAARDYGPRYDGALNFLQMFARPLPRLLCSLIRFSRNDFAIDHLAFTGFSLLDSANAQLSPISRNGGDWPQPALSHIGEAKLPICPVDNGSSAVLWRAGQLATTARWSQDLEDQLRGETDLATLDPEDRQKLYAIWAATAIRLRKQECALYPLGNLAGSFSFGQWADGLLEEFEGS